MIDDLDSARDRDHRRAARRGLLRRAFARWEALIEAGIAWYVRHARPRDEAPPRGGPGRRRAAGGELVLAWAPRCAASSSPRSMRAPSRSTPGPQRHPDRGDREEDRQGRAVRPGEDRRRTCRSSSPRSAWSPTCRPPTPPTPARWTRSSRSSSSTSASTRRRSTSNGSATGWPRTRSSATWSSPSTPAA